MSDETLRLDLLPKIQDQRLRRVIIARAAGVKYTDIAEAENISTERARQLYANGRRLLDLLSRVPERLSADTSVVNILASVRFRNACKSAGVRTLGDLANLTPRQFLCIKNCSSRTFAEARRLLMQAGLQFIDNNGSDDIN